MSEYHYGGQAILEGVMMRGRQNVSVAVRAPSGKIVTHREPLDSPLYRSPLSKLPFVRGLVMLWDTLALGYRALTFSANVALEEEDVKFGGGMMWGTLIVSLLFGIGLFFLLPTFLVGLIDRTIDSAFLSNLVEGFIRIAIFLGYLAAISLLPDIRRVFAYHGAEHKAVNAYEAGVPLEVTSVQRRTTAHTRCGTSFLLAVMVIFVLLSTLLGRPPFWQRLLWRIVLIPVVAGISYEWLKFSAAHDDHPVMRWLTAPGLALQRFSTREPSDDMVEVAIVALRDVIAADAGPSDATADAALIQTLQQNTAA